MGRRKKELPPEREFKETALEALSAPEYLAIVESFAKHIFVMAGNNHEVALGFLARVIEYVAVMALGRVDANKVLAEGYEILAQMFHDELDKQPEKDGADE